MSETLLAPIAQGAARPAAGGIRLWLDALRAAAELARARLLFGGADLAALVGHPPVPAAPANDGVSELTNRAAYVLPRLARRVPWRSDCLIQALAAQHWLESAGIASAIRIGGRTRNGRFDAHAWLVAEGVIVTGWDHAELASYAEFVRREGPPAPAD